MTPHRPPTPEESMHIAGLFLDAAIAYAEEGHDQAVALIDDYFRCDNETASYRVWYWAAVGPIIAAAGIKKVNPCPPNQGEFWGIESLPGARPGSVGPSRLASLQCVAAHLNGDEGLAQDVTSAHFEVAGHDGLFEMVLEFVALSAFLVKEGAFR